ncbi:sirohydrochlorin chelatase [Streptomyces lydicus]|uniref:Cobalamin biosynthesis protein CbiX n=1 Tax=Streptomyces lydicus TaxID=47763 RepID=A0A1D7VIF8_9ACTN|nr:sirohydrochlorin chelatase [Streptomyces lydicus]AOP46501.1 cobalamin biosynthesis protein CbiX [Streptomyces lydicus]
MTTPPALLIAGYGTRDEDGAEALRALVRGLDARHPEVPVAGGFFGTPGTQAAPDGPGAPLPLGDAVGELVARGASHVVAVPLLLAPTGPVAQPLAAALERAVRRHPGLGHTCGAELGPHPRLLDAMERRLDEALGEGARTPLDRARTTVLLVGRGASDPYANAEVARAARLLWEGRGFAGVETAFVSQAAPDVPAGLDRCRTLAAAAPAAGGPGRVVVAPYFLFAGGLFERLCMQAEGWAAAHPDIEVYGAHTLGAGPEVAEVVMERYHEAVADGPRAAAGDARGTHRTARESAPATAGAGDR